MLPIVNRDHTRRRTVLSWPVVRRQPPSVLVFASEATLTSAVLESIAQILVKAVSAELVQLSIAASNPFPCVAFWVPVHRPKANVAVVNKVGELE